MDSHFPRFLANSDCGANTPTRSVTKFSGAPMTDGDW
jgi:hypothetical protein